MVTNGACLHLLLPSLWNVSPLLWCMAETSVLRILYHVHHSLKPGSLSCCQMTYKCSLLNLPWPLLSLMEDRTEFHIRQCQGCHVSHQMPASGSGSPRWKSCAQRAASSLNYQRTCLCKHTARNPMTGAFAWTCLSFVEGYSHSTLRLEKSHSKIREQYTWILTETEKYTILTQAPGIPSSNPYWYQWATAVAAGEGNEKWAGLQAGEHELLKWATLLYAEWIAVGSGTTREIWFISCLKC